jgi:hypothetical protein
MGVVPSVGPSSCYSRFLDRASTELLQELHAPRARRDCRHLKVSARKGEALTNRERDRAPSGSPVMRFLAWPGWALNKSGGIEWLASAGSRGSQSYLGPCAKHGHPLREQAMAVRLGSRDEHRVMEAMADVSLVTKGSSLPARTATAASIR